MSIITQTTEKINYETGEVVERQNVIVQKNTKEEYVRFFLNSIESIVEAKLTATEHNVLYMLQKYTINNSNLLFYNDKIRKQIAKDLNVKPDTVRKSVEKLVKTGLIERPERGMYYLNPIHFGRGDWASIKKLRKEIVYEYDFDRLEMSRQDKTIATYAEESEIQSKIAEQNAITVETEVIDNKTVEHIVSVESKKTARERALEKLRVNAKKHLVIKEALNAQSSVEIREAGESNK